MTVLQNNTKMRKMKMYQERNHRKMQKLDLKVPTPI